MDLTTWAWILAAFGAALVGFGKCGFPGSGNVSVVLFAHVFGAAHSVGILLPVLIVGDVFAIILYRR